MGTLAVRAVLASAAALAVGAGPAAAVVPYEVPQTVRDRLGVVREEQTMRVELSPGTGRALLYADHGAGGGYITPRLVLRRVDGSWTAPERVNAGTRTGGNAGGDTVIAGTVGGAVRVGLIPRGSDAVAVAEPLPGVTLEGAPGMAEDGTVGVAVRDAQGAIGLRRLAADGTWSALALDLQSLAPQSSVDVLRVQPEPDGSTRLVALTSRANDWGLVHVRVLADGSVTEVDRAALALGKHAWLSLRRGPDVVPSVMVPGGAVLVVLAASDRGGNALKVLAVTRAAGGGWSTSVVTTNRIALVTHAMQHFGASAALDADGTAAVTYAGRVASVYVRPSGTARWGRAIPLASLDTDAGRFAVPGVALAGEVLRTAWGASPFLIAPRGNQWRIVERTLAPDPASVTGGQWPTALAAVGPVRATHTGPFAYRLQVSVRLRAGPSVVFFALDRCAPSCGPRYGGGAPPDHAIHGRVGANAVSWRMRTGSGRYRLRVYVPGPDGVIQLVRFVTLR